MYLGIDLGTSELKVVIVDRDHRVVASEAEPLAISRPHPLWSEQDPADWWSALDAAVLRLRTAHPAALAAVRAIGPTGEHVSEMSDASGTLWLDVARRNWSDDLLAATRLARANMPRLVEGSAISGQLRPALARRWGLRPGLAVAGGGGDNAASAV